MSEENYICIGKYRISDSDESDNDPLDDKIWISNGIDGGQFSTKDLEALIDKFYKDNF